MINVVTWLDTDKYRSELLSVCASNGIRIVEDEFLNIEEFLHIFNSIDTNIDVLVVSNTNLESVDKRQFFENVCTTEPNLRIVIIFPGYRNEYIEQQISDYRKMGISDIIYEGQYLDCGCFVEVIKKGYIYDYDVNVYDEPQEVIKPLSKKPHCITIGVMGITRGCGVTNMTVNIAEYISLAEGCSVKAVDFSGTGNLRFAKGKKVTFVVHSDIDITRMKKTSRAIVFDFGTPYNISSKGKLLSVYDSFNEEKIKIFKECDLKFIMCFSDSWHIGKIKYFFNDKEWRRDIDSSYVFLADKELVKFGPHAIKISGRNGKTVSEEIGKLFIEKGGT